MKIEAGMHAIAKPAPAPQAPAPARNEEASESGAERAREIAKNPAGKGGLVDVEA